MYANPWTPAGGSAYGAVSSTGGFASTPAPVPAGTPATPAGQLAAMPAPDPRLQLAISSAFNTAQRVDDMLMVTNKGVAVSWPQRTVSIEYFTALSGMQAEPIPEPSADIKKRIADAQKALYLMDADGNFTGYTPRHTAYRHNQKALADARSELALAYSQAMSDPVLGQAWPVTSAKYQNAVDQAYNDFKDMGGQQIDDAIATLQSVQRWPRRRHRGEGTLVLYRPCFLVGPHQQGLRRDENHCHVETVPSKRWRRSAQLWK
jgi:hypothetical protein